MSLLSPIAWLGSMLVAMIVFVVVAMRDNARQRAAALALQPKVTPVTDVDGMSSDGLGDPNDFPAESLEFDESTFK